MELWTEARALKASLRGESTTSLKHHQLIVSEDLSRTSSLSEDFSVECFLDFSEGQKEEEELVSVSSSQEEQEQEQDCIFSSQPCIFDQLPSLPVNLEAPFFFFFLIIKRYLYFLDFFFYFFYFVIF